MVFALCLMQFLLSVNTTQLFDTARDNRRSVKLFTLSAGLPVVARSQPVPVIGNPTNELVNSNSAHIHEQNQSQSTLPQITSNDILVFTPYRQLSFARWVFHGCFG